MQNVANLRDFKDSAKLAFNLALAKFKIRNEGSYLGIFWYLIDPLLLFLVILFVKNAAFNISIENYPMYLITGLLIFNFFTKATSAGLTSISKNKNFIKSMKISYFSLVACEVLQIAFAHVFEFILLIIFALFFGANALGFVLYPLIFIFYFIFVLGISFILSTIHVYVSDLENIWKVICTLLLFILPIFHVISSLTIKANALNPLFYFIDSARGMILSGTLPEITSVLIIVLSGLLSLTIGLGIFSKYKSGFAERL